MPAYVKSPKKDCADCKAGVCMAHGGGVHSPVATGTGKDGTSLAGLRTKTAKQKEARGDIGGAHADRIEARALHRENLDELKSMKGPHGNYAEGGEVEGDDDHDEIHDMLGEEFTSAVHRKDHKGASQALKAMIENHLSKRGK